ncbi:UDP-galactose transporter senju isoform X2 [Cydia pomonella]|uniref:UDP-galactose transporter senju isoform X2 n=1 Tax=Cydia pomonella TaxID=82600 RepID=UPI002ADE5847|nr:UDP-galactose transporter senju isoform X2 [Cydia pomonella]
MKALQDLFPNKEGFIIFALYIILFVFQGVFVTASKNANGGYSYNTTLVVFLTELLKLVASATLYSYRRNDKPHIFRAVALNYKLLLLYFIPSLLYCFYNNLAFVNLSHYDPTSYYILLQFRIVLTAILFQCLFQKKLTLMQWVSLGILTLGCILKNFDAASVQSKTGETDVWSQKLHVGGSATTCAHFESQLNAGFRGLEASGNKGVEAPWSQIIFKLNRKFSEVSFVEAPVALP